MSHLIFLHFRQFLSFLVTLFDRKFSKNSSNWSIFGMFKTTYFVHSKCKRSLLASLAILNKTFSLIIKHCDIVFCNFQAAATYIEQRKMQELFALFHAFFARFAKREVLLLMYTTTLTCNFERKKSLLGQFLLGLKLGQLLSCLCCCKQRNKLVGNIYFAGCGLFRHEKNLRKSFMSGPPN